MQKFCWAIFFSVSILLGAVPPAVAATPEPEITLRYEEDRILEEYRINGQLYAIKVTPKKGKPYYLVDSEGKGQLEVHQERGSLQVPSWILLQW